MHNDLPQVFVPKAHRGWLAAINMYFNRIVRLGNEIAKIDIKAPYWSRNAPEMVCPALI